MPGLRLIPPAKLQPETPPVEGPPGPLPGDCTQAEPAPNIRDCARGSAPVIGKLLDGFKRVDRVAYETLVFP